MRLVIFDCDGVLVDSEPISVAYASGLTPADILSGPRTIVFDEMRALPQLITAR